jgi:hypothetical protein
VPHFLRGRSSHAIPSLSRSRPCGSLCGPPAATKNSCASSWVSKSGQSRSGPLGSYFSLLVGVIIGFGEAPTPGAVAVATSICVGVACGMEARTVGVAVAEGRTDVGRPRTGVKVAVEVARTVLVCMAGADVLVASDVVGVLVGRGIVGDRIIRVAT